MPFYFQIGRASGEEMYQDYDYDSDGDHLHQDHHARPLWWSGENEWEEKKQGRDERKISFQKRLKEEKEDIFSPSLCIWDDGNKGTITTKL